MERQKDNLMQRARNFFAPPEQQLVSRENVVRFQKIPKKDISDSLDGQTSQAVHQTWVDLGSARLYGRYKGDAKRMK